MTLKIDQAGRIVVPKSVRERFGLRAGADLELEETSDGFSLKPLAREPSLKRVGRFLVHTGQAPAGFNVVSAIAEEREELMRRQTGL